MKKVQEDTRNQILQKEKLHLATTINTSWAAMKIQSLLTGN